MKKNSYKTPKGGAFRTYFHGSRLTNGASLNSAMDEGFTDWNDFVRCWDSTIKPAYRDIYGWAANPWVWVIELDRITKEEVEHG